ncbi:Methyltransferase-like protein 21D [Lobosporangium transversale]|uniref:Putative methyltransferase-domain-containing protein n=1 Tax=Lobosporangium transversale TaxID=64571 RepID=A0A1Y2GCA1_9FUNG|nr:putative methyltransferase-domain-containing protein [Lobosporangium transversale]KAF9915027.1 Methyltransferase-like protein 21D [Lobosporangium transversale]ORZ06816.1 putative methyltransferase-domain-containing protein [Lobosporangium transversale]|eukprot:XP_021877737.1 putative methyltransferase-domain-containing protein [Lobosporangium transversale]
MEHITLASREYEFRNHTIKPLDIDEDPSGLLRGGVGSTIWDAAIVLAKYLEKSNLLSIASSSTSATETPRSSTPINVLELGAGTGIVGLAVARLLSAKGVEARVLLTDKENVVPLLSRNIQRNPSIGIDIQAQTLDWEEDESSSSSSNAQKIHALIDTNWDMVILSDCIWVPGLYKPLISTINALITPSASKTQLVIAFEKRNFAEEMEFFAMLGKTFRFRDIKPEEQDADYQSEDIYLFVCQRRS